MDSWDGLQKRFSLSCFRVEGHIGQPGWCGRGKLFGPGRSRFEWPSENLG